jgi:hypothetical protein
MQAVPPRQLDRFIVEWAEARSMPPAETCDCIALYRKILSLSNRPALAMKGLVVLIKGAIVALSLWDISNKDFPSANRFVNLCDTSYRGIADYTTKRLADRLLADGILYLSIGGSETETLDRFKRKFQPAFSVPLHSVDVIYE